MCGLVTFPLPNELGIATLSLGHHSKHRLEPRLREAAAAGFQVIDLFDEDWEAYLEEHGLDSTRPWEATEDKLALAVKLRNIIASLGMRIACTQPLRDIEGCIPPKDREAAMRRVSDRFPFMRAFDTDLVFMCSNKLADDLITTTADFQTVVRDLREIGDMAMEFSRRDGGKVIRIGYEPLSWARRNTWSSAWEIVRAVDKENVGIILDSFNILAVEFADPYSDELEGGMLHGTRDRALRILRDSMAAMVATVRAEKIFFVQLGDGERMDPKKFQPPVDRTIPRLLPWSRSHRLFPMEQSRGGYMPVDLVLAAILQTGYTGPLSLEVFSHSVHEEGEVVPQALAERGVNGLRALMKESLHVPRYSLPARL